MARCNSCSAPLAANSNRCVYCGTYNDVDLKGKHQYSVRRRISERKCPHCDRILQTIALDEQQSVFIERCDNCFGLFFDPGELKTFLQNSVSGVFDFNLQRISNINKNRYRNNQKVRYIKCPQCRTFMNRINYGYRSGVIVDRCKKHGVWLDNGELTHLLEWKKAGGQMLHERYKRKAESEKKQQYKKRPLQASNYSFESRHRYQGGGQKVDLMETISSLIFKLFD